MKKNLLFILICSTFVFAQNSRIKKLGTEGIELVYDMKFDEANAVFDEIIKLEPKNGYGYFLKSVSYNWLFMLDNNNESVGEMFEEASFLAAEISEEMLDNNENDVDAMFYLGGAYGNLGRYFGMTNSWLKAYWYGKKGKNYLEDVVELAPEYYDAYLGLGIFHYYMDVLPGIIKSLSFIFGLDGSREEGLKEIQLSIDKGGYVKTEAMFFLGHIYQTIESDYDKALPIFLELSNKYPHNYIFSLNLGKCYARTKKHDLAIEVYRKGLSINASKKVLPFRDYFNYYLGNIFYKQNKLNNAIAAYLSISHNSNVYYWGLFSVGECYELLDSLDKAKIYYAKIDDEDSRAYDNAQERLEKPLNKTDIALIKGINYFDCEQYSKAQMVLLSAINIAEKKNNINENVLAELYYRLGKTEYELEKYNKAIKIFNKIFPFDDIEDEWIIPWTHYRIGNCYLKLSDKTNALKEYDISYSDADTRLKIKINKAKENIKLEVPNN